MISIIIPAYNLENYIEECLGSILAQTYQDFEVIVVDDGSSDNTATVAQAYASVDERISVIENRHSNAGMARNAGLEVAQGEYLLFFDGDDYLAPTMLETTLARAEAVQADITICRSFSFYDGNTDELIDNPGPFFVDLDDVYDSEKLGLNTFTMCEGWPWDKLIRADFVREHQLKFQSLSSTNDAYFIYMAIALAKRIAFVGERLAYHRRRQTSIERSRSGNPHNAYNAYEALHKTLSASPRWEGLFKPALTNWGLNHMRWNFRTLHGPARHEAFTDYLRILRTVFTAPPEYFVFKDDLIARDALVHPDESASERLVDLALDLMYTREDLTRVADESRGLREEIARRDARIGELQSQIEEQQRRFEELEAHKGQADARIQELEQSTTFRVGKAVTAGPRLLKRLYDDRKTK